MILSDHALALLGWALVGGPIIAFVGVFLFYLADKRRESVEDDDTWKDWPG